MVHSIIICVQTITKDTLEYRVFDLVSVVPMMDKTYKHTYIHVNYMRTSTRCHTYIFQFHIITLVIGTAFISKCMYPGMSTSIYIRMMMVNNVMLSIVHTG